MNSSCKDCPINNVGLIKKLGEKIDKYDFHIALAGNPNVGKSTVFNNLTGLRQHTGNWPGKTVTRAEGGYEFSKKKFRVIDLPGTYSLLSTSTDEDIARNFILFGKPDVTVVVVDATKLERNLNLVLQILEITSNVVVALNLIDEAKRKNISINARQLSKDLGVPVVPMSARRKEGMSELIDLISQVATGEYICKPKRISRFSKKVQHAIDDLTDAINELYPTIANSRWIALRLLEGDEKIISSINSNEIEKLFAKELDREGNNNSKENRSNKTLLEKAKRYRWELGDEFHDKIVEDIFAEASRIASRAVTFKNKTVSNDWDVILDRIVINKYSGFLVMFLLLALVLWITVQGANYPSALLSTLLLDKFLPVLHSAANMIGLPIWLSGIIIDGGYLAMAWVISVMLPPMAIFFPLFTLLEDFGYLPRVAFNMDNLFRKVGAHGKQALTMTMGFGCNAAGVVATRIIDSPRERLIAIITNNFSLCNGRWPTQILLATIFVGALAPPALAGIVSAAAVIGIVLLGVFFSLLVSYGLSKTLLKGEASSFSLELPPYRPPRILQTLYTSLIDRTLIVLWRAIVFAFPAGLVIWLLANVNIDGFPIAKYIVDSFNPAAMLFGLNGIIILAFIIAIPANEIVIPTILMLTVLLFSVAGYSHGVMFELDSVSDTAKLLQLGGWTLLTAINVMIFSLVHNPCSTTIYTIYKETGSLKWTSVATFLPVILGLLLTFVVTQIWNLFG